jgi:hypothetical protein
MLDPDKMVEGRLDEDLLEDPLMAEVDQDIEDGEDADFDLLRRGKLSDSDMIDIVDEADPIEIIDNL